jgi:hypothetical protein
MYTTPTETRVKKMLPTNSVHALSKFLGKGTARRMRQKSGMGKNIHIM